VVGVDQDGHGIARPGRNESVYHNVLHLLGTVDADRLHPVARQSRSQAQALSGCVGIEKCVEWPGDRDQRGNVGAGWKKAPAHLSRWN
jgi:hypothetical protein